MAIHIPSNLYSGGNVTLDNTPYLRIAMQSRMRKEARNQALNQYYEKMPDTVNDKGTRDQEIPIINQMKDEMQQFGMKNRAALINPKIDGGAAQLGMQKMFRNVGAVVRKSQSAGLVDHQAGQMYFNPKNQDLLNSDYFIQAHEKHNLPVTDANFKQLDLADVTANRPFDDNSFTKEIKTKFPYSEGVPVVSPHPTDSNLETVTTNPQLNEPTKLQMYAYATEKYHNDRTFQRKIDNDIKTDQQLAQLNDVSKKVFGHDIKTPEDKAAAFTASQLPTTAVRTAVRVNAGFVRDANSENKKDAATLAYERSLNKQRIGIQAHRDNLREMMSGSNTVGSPLDIYVKESKHSTPKYYSAEGVPMGASDDGSQRVYEKDMPAEEYNIINKKSARGARSVEPKVDPHTKENYFDVKVNSEGETDFEGDNGTISGRVARKQIINTIPKGKGQAIYFNKGAATGTKTTGASKIQWK